MLTIVRQGRSFVEGLAGHLHRYLLPGLHPLAVCDNHRIHQHQVFAGLAQRGKTSTGWCFDFKLHLVFNDRGELLTILANNA